jgi:putative membrane protein
MAVLFYLPRLFIYHRENAGSTGFTDVVKIQEYKLFKYIGVPAMWTTVISGGLMLSLNMGIFSSVGWMHAKLFAIALLLAYHVSLGKIRVIMIDTPEFKTSKWLRMYNEVPTFLMIFIVIMVVVKPF